MGCSTQKCPVAACVQPKEGCKYVPSNEKNDDGCPKYACGKLVCEDKKTCCEAISKECLSCAKDMAVEQYCGEKNIQKDEEAKRLCNTQKCPVAACVQPKEGYKYVPS